MSHRTHCSQPSSAEERIMKKRYYSLAVFLLMGLIVSTAWSQTYEATIDVTITGSQLLVDLYLRTTSGVSAKLGDATLVVNYNGNALSYVGKDAAFDGRWDNGNSADYQDLSSSNVTTPTARASLDIVKNSGGVGLDIPTSFPPDPANRVGRIVFTIVNASLTPQLTWRTTATSIFNYAGTSMKSEVTFTNPTDNPLPIQLASFAASVVRNNDVEVAWKTVSETNNYGFEIYRRRGEAGEWTKIAFVEGHGTTLTPQSYSHIDRDVAFGKYSYQIKQMDLDGKSKVYPEAEVVVGIAPGTFIVGQNYPNPFNPSTTIEFVVPQNGLATMKVYNILGQEVATLFEGSAEAGKIYTVNFNGSDLASGLYFYTVSSAGKMQTKRMLMMK
jgi:hypothetical protein